MADMKDTAISQARENTSPDELRQHKARAKKAWSSHEEWDKILMDAYDFIAPYRKSELKSKTSPGNRVDRIFDSTAPVALLRMAGKLQQELAPPGQPFIMFEPGPLIAAKGMDEDDVRKQLEGISRLVHPVFMTGEWDNALHEMLIDVGISTGFMMVLEGDMDNPVRFVTASMDEVAIDQGPYGTVAGIFFKRKWSRRAIFAAFPKGKYNPSFMESLKSQPETELILCQDSVYEPNEKRWCLKVYIESEKELIHSSDSRECIWLTPRYFRMPGQAYGFGPALMALPTTKTLNKAQELSLKTAALSMLGIYTALDDGVFNPDTARLEPGAIWKVASNGGVRGKSIERLDPPGNPQLANIALQDLRGQVQMTMMDQSLPPDGHTPRSAAEIVERVKQLSTDFAGAFGRLIHEILMPVTRRVLEILHNLGILPAKITIDQLLISVRFTSPLAAAFKAQQVSTLVNWLQMVAQLGGAETLHKITPLDKVFVEMGYDMGIPHSKMYDTDTRQQIDKTVKQLVQQALAAQQQAQQAPPVPNGDPSQALQGAA